VSGASGARPDRLAPDGPPPSRDAAARDAPTRDAAAPEAPEADAVPAKPGARPAPDRDVSVTARAAQRLPRGLRNLALRFEHLVHELGKFGIVGVISYVLDTGVLKTALSAGINPLLAKTLSTAIAATAAFLGNRFWTWRDRPRSGLHREYALYFLFNAVGLGIGLTCLGISHYLLGRVWPVLTTEVADVISANVVGMAFGTLFRFWSYRRFVFKNYGT
jgi:putative flippase GtrA